MSRLAATPVLEVVEHAGRLFPVYEAYHHVPEVERQSWFICRSGSTHYVSRHLVLGSSAEEYLLTDGEVCPGLEWSDRRAFARAYYRTVTDAADAILRWDAAQVPCEDW